MSSSLGGTGGCDEDVEFFADLVEPVVDTAHGRSLTRAYPPRPFFLEHPARLLNTQSLTLLLLGSQS